MKKTKAPTNQKMVYAAFSDLLEELAKEKMANVEENRKMQLLKKVRAGQRRCISLEKRYQKLRPFLSEAERMRLDEYSGWFEHQDN